jgi:hypothetical protein
MISKQEELSIRQKEDASTLISSVLGTFVIANYTYEERVQVWQNVRDVVEAYLESTKP